MKIGVISNFFPPYSVGGYERLCSAVCDELTALGHDLAVLTSDYCGGAPAESTESINRRLKLLVHYSDIYRPFEIDPGERSKIDGENVKELASFLGRHGCDLVFVWNLYFLGSGFILSLLQHCPRVVMFLTDNWLIAQQRPEVIGEFFTNHVHGNETFRPGSTSDTPAITMKARAIFGSQFVLDLYRNCGFRFEGEIVIHNGVRLPMVPRELPIDRTNYRSGSAVKLLFAGRVVDVKGVHLLIDALSLLKDQLPSGQTVSLSVVGDCQDREYLQRLHRRIAELECNEIVKFHSPVAETDLLSLFSDHDIYVFPSLYEPFSLTLIHALAAGIPTVATDIGGNNEIVVHEKTGLLFDKGSPRELAFAIMRLIRDSKLRTKLAKRSPRVARRFSFDRMIWRINMELQAVS